jgi:hypothetical protein
LYRPAVASLDGEIAALDGAEFQPRRDGLALARFVRSLCEYAER